MRKIIYLAVVAIAVTVGSMFIPVGSLGPQQAQALFIPVPESSSLILLGTGLAALVRYLRPK